MVNHFHGVQSNQEVNSHYKCQEQVGCFVVKVLVVKCMVSIMINKYSPEDVEDSDTDG
jgi:hypothetical protein